MTRIVASSIDAPNARSYGQIMNYANGCAKAAPAMKTAASTNSIDCL